MINIVSSNPEYAVGVVSAASFTIDLDWSTCLANVLHLPALFLASKVKMKEAASFDQRSLP